MADESNRAGVVVIAHRGASGERPEHTLESYRLAIEQGADYIEPDLVMTRDGVLIARHENEIGGTTDVADHAQFASRRRTQPIDGEAVTGWFTEDFTLAEIKRLRARERLPGLRPDNRAYDDVLEIPTFAEILALAAAVNRARPQAPRLGVYPETKHPAHFAALGLAQETPLLQALQDVDYHRAGSPVFIQSFDPRNLRELAQRTPLPLVQLLEHSIGDIEGIARYAQAIGIPKSLTDARVVARAHACGLAVHVWTFRAENQFLPEAFKVGGAPAAHGDLAGELAHFLALGIDGFFTDFPRLGVQARNLAASTFQRPTPSTSP